MTCAEAQRWRSGTTVLPVVICVGDAEVARVFGTVLVAVANQGCLPVIMEVVAANN
jgi:type III secretory pathway component EscU